MSEACFRFLFLTLQSSHEANLTTPARSDAPVYSKEYLSELRANTTAPPRRPAPTVEDDVDMSFEDPSAALLAASSVDADVDMPTAEAIPSESSVKAAKQKRERLRGSESAADEYISLEVSKRGEDNGPHPESRLVREDDELGEGEDGNYHAFVFVFLTEVQIWRNILAPKNALLLVRMLAKKSSARRRPA